ncbi:MAG: hypothetical protein Q7U36_01040, partial [bacterium]|nr:hypothetical protein [bacterium]
VKKFILFEVRRIWSGRVINFSEKVENLSFYELGWPFSFLPLFFWEKKNGEEPLMKSLQVQSSRLNRIILVIFYNYFILPETKSSGETPELAI